jgi:CO/xanthine dehydrogenase Mo-binding subunit
VLRESVSAAEVLREAVKRSKYHALRKKGGEGKGVGVALYWHGSGFTGGGEVKLASKAALEVTKTGVRVLVASTEIGQGTRTMHAQIVADALGLPFDWIETMDPDTAKVPDSGPTVASRTCMVVGRILQRCAEALRAQLKWRSPAEFRRLAKKHAGLRLTMEYEKPGEIQWDDATYRGDAYGAYAWGCVVAPVEVDRSTYQVRPLTMTVVSEIGRAIHPVFAAGQIEGGTVQAIGWALLEEVVMKNGRMANGQLTNYIIPTSLDVPKLDVALLESPYRHGPFGAKGVGELPMDGPGPALVNAVNHALGTEIASIPMTPERISEAVSR